MATEITLTINDDGSMEVEHGEKQETLGQEKAEGGQSVPVKSLDEALQAIKSLAEAVAPPNAGQVADQNDEQEQEQAGMMQGFQR
jgi:hypothetical protein